jgi:hypothetical protein
MIARRIIAGAAAGLLMIAGGAVGCLPQARTQNALSQNTGEAGSTVPRSSSPYYPNTAGNIVAPPGNPGGNGAGAPPIVGGTENQRVAWPEGR